MIFGHFIYFGHFPIEIPIEAEKYYHHGKELSYRENKMCSETSEAVGTIWEHAQKEFQKFLKIRITLMREAQLYSQLHGEPQRELSSQVTLSARRDLTRQLKVNEMKKKMQPRPR